MNSKKFEFKPSEIDYVFIGHGHIDHIGLLPRLIKEGFKGKVILTQQTAEISKALLLNCSYILSEEARILSKRYDREYLPLYTEDDVYRTLDFYYPHDEYNHLYKLDENVSFEWLPNSHCVGAAQLRLILTDELRCKKILYTSDIGSINTKNHYVENTVIPDTYTDVAILETTYGGATRAMKKTREFDLEHLRVAINTVLERRGSVIMPAFSFCRSQELLTNLYDLFGNDHTFKTDVIVDSKLTCEISNIYSSILTGEHLNKWKKVLSWKNLRFISEKTDSQAILSDNTPKIIISSSGFCTNGRILNYLSKYLPDINSMIIFSGYTGDNPSYLSYRIQHYKAFHTIKIKQIPIINRADCITLSTFSSHANHNELIQYGSSLNTNQLILVHGSESSKNCLAEKLKLAISQNDKTYKVKASHIGMAIHL